MSYQSLSNNLYNPSSTVGTSGTTLVLSDTTQSTGTDSGALVVEGGAGIAKDVFIGGDLDVTGTLTVGGSPITAGITVGGVGWGQYAVNNSGGSIANNGTTTGDNLLYFVLDTSGNKSNGGAIGSSGTTWRNTGGTSVTGTYVGFFTRIS